MIPSHCVRTPRHLSPLAQAGRTALSALLCSLLAGPATAGERAGRNLADLSIEELMNESVTSVSKKATRLSESPAAITIITQDDIRRLGFGSIPEALRSVPGLDVARVDASNWAIGSRGFNGPYANKLLVLVDGRSVYTPMFGGVYWVTQDMVLEDLERIEAIRGPGATLWGANAVNGVINIISKPARETQGALVSSSFGTEDRPSVSVRYGGALAPNLHYRVYAKKFARDGFVDPSGAETPDAWRSSRAGFRADWQPTQENLLTVQGDAYAIRADENVMLPQLTPPFRTSLNTEAENHGTNLLGRWTHTFSARSSLSLQAYLDHYRREGGLSIESRDTADFELERRFPLGDRHDIVTGFGYRFTTDEVNNTALVRWTPSNRALRLFTAFIQDEVALVPERLSVTLGSKFEHNDFTGLEIQPGVRLLWTPTRRQTVWAAVSRAVSTPSRFNRGGRLNTAVFQPSPSSQVIVAAVLGNPHSVSETVKAFEAGYRVEPRPALSFDFTVFYNVYDHLNSAVAGDVRFEADPAPPHLLLPLNLQNAVAGETHGAEISMQWKPLDRWRLMASYSHLEMNLSPEDPSLKASPRHQASMRSYLALPGNLEFNSAAYYVGPIEARTTTASVPVPGYLRLDLGFIWRPQPGLELGVWGQNLLTGQHPETAAITTPLRTEVPRSFVGRVTWRF